MATEIIKTDDPNIVIERTVVDKEKNLLVLQNRISELNQLRDGLIDIIILKVYPEEVKKMIEARNAEYFEQRLDIDNEIESINNEIKRLWQ